MLLVTVGTAVALCVVSVVGMEVGVGAGVAVGLTGSPPQFTSNVIVVHSKSSCVALKVICKALIDPYGFF